MKYYIKDFVSLVFVFPIIMFLAMYWALDSLLNIKVYDDGEKERYTEEAYF